MGIYHLEWLYHYIVSSIRYKFDFPLIYGEDTVKKNRNNQQYLHFGVPSKYGRQQ